MSNVGTVRICDDGSLYVVNAIKGETVYFTPLNFDFSGTKKWSIRYLDCDKKIEVKLINILFGLSAEDELQNE